MTPWGSRFTSDAQGSRPGRADVLEARPRSSTPGAFSFELDEQGVALQIVGSSRPLVGIRNLNCFDFEAGGFDASHEVGRSMTVNGTDDPEAEVFFTIGGGSVGFESDELPGVFPMTGEGEDFACVSADTWCVTFSVRESTFGDSFLMTLLELR